MKLATVQTGRGATYGIVTDKGFVDLGPRLGSRYPDLKSLIAARALGEAQKFAGEKPDDSLAELKWLPVIPNPGKILCVGLNYRDHAEETGAKIPEEPILFSKYPTAVIGPEAPIVLPNVSQEVDYEAELVVVIGSKARHVPVDREVGTPPHRIASGRTSTTRHMPSKSNPTIRSATCWANACGANACGVSRSIPGSSASPCSSSTIRIDPSVSCDSW